MRTIRSSVDLNADDRRKIEALLEAEAKKG